MAELLEVNSPIGVNNHIAAQNLCYSYYYPNLKRLLIRIPGQGPVPARSAPTPVHEHGLPWHSARTLDP